MKDIVEYLRQNVPLSLAMGIQAGRLTDQYFELNAPFAPNVNDKNTAFGGSLATLCTLSAWCITAWLCQQAQLKTDIVILDSDIRYRLPTTADPIIARAYMPSEADLAAFLLDLKNASQARLALKAEISNEGKASVHFSGRYHARLIKQIRACK